MRRLPFLYFCVMLTILIVYVVTIALIKYEVFVDTWPLNNIVMETLAFLVVIALLPTRMFHVKKASILFTYVVTVFMVIYLPLLKYPNDLWLYGPWDSSAHYSFASWVVEKGYVPANNELFYSNQYGRHPGNGLIPVVLNIVSQMNPLTISMFTVLSASYVTYALLLLALVISFNVQNMTRYLTTLSLLCLFTLYLPYYGGIELAYAFVALITYLIIGTFSSKSHSVASHILMIIVYTGLLITHFSTATIILYFMALMLVGSIILKRLQILTLNNKKLISTFMVMGLFFLAYELYVDVYLAGLTLRESVRRLMELYIRELEIARHAIEYNPYISIGDLIIYLISQYTKSIIILVSIGIYVSYRLYAAKRNRTSTPMTERSTLFILLILSLSTWLLGWFGVGNFMSGGRAMPLIQFFFSISIMQYLGENKILKTQGSLMQVTISSLFIILFLLGFFSNYSIHIGPYLTSLEGDSYTYPVWTQGAVSPFVLDSIRFLNRFLAEDSTYRFLCVQPYTGFGLCDLLWNKPKTPVHGFVSPRLTTSEAMTQLLDKYINVIIPMPSSDGVVPGPIGYTSLYRNPFLYILTHGGGIIYSNPYYKLVTK